MGPATAPMVEDSEIPEVMDIPAQTLALALTPKQVVDRIKPILVNAVDEDVTADDSFLDSGMDSLNAVGFRNEVAKLMDVTLPATVVFDFPSLSGLADYIVTVQR